MRWPSTFWFATLAVATLSGCGGAGPLGPGAAAPELVADGWLNGTAPGKADLEGKVVVVDVWAYW